MNSKITQTKFTVETHERALLTQRQKNLIRRIVTGHLESAEFVTESVRVFICKYFVELNIDYYPTSAIGAPGKILVEKHAQFRIGVNGGMLKHTQRSALGKEHGGRLMRRIAESYFTPSY